MWDRLLAPFRRSLHPTARIAVTLWGKPDCSLCDKAMQVLDRLSQDFPLDVQKRDITVNPDDFERYRYVIPVVQVADGPTFEGKISEHRLRQALDQLVMTGRSHSDG